MAQINALAATAAILFAIFYFLIKLSYRVCYSPLNSAPDAHWSVKLCGLWIWWHRVKERDAPAVQDAHVRCGPVVRLGPNEVSVNDVDGGLKPIYDGRMPKHDFYQVAVSYGEKPLVSIKPEELHRQQKRMLAKPYNKTQMMSNHEWQKERQSLAQELVEGLTELTSKEPDPELYDVFFAWSVASISAYLFGREGCLNLLQDIPEAGRVRKAYYGQRVYQFVAIFLPIPSKVFDWLGYYPELEWIRQLQDRAQENQRADSTQTSSDGWTSVYDTMKQSLLVSSTNSSNKQLSAKQVAVISAEMQDHVIAGVDTSATGLTCCAYELSRKHNQHWQERLRKELLSIDQSSDDRDFERLPVLDAIIRETLRLYPPAAGGLPRVSDKDVSLGPPEHEVMIPVGTKVHCQAYSLHRSSIFEDAELFRPERWLDCTPEKKKEMDRWFWAFGSGTRKCIGEHLAMSNLRVAVAAIWSSFETAVTPSTQMVLTEGMILMPIQNAAGDFIRLQVRKLEA